MILSSLSLDADPNNYMSYYKRATVFLALSRSRPALADLDKVIVTNIGERPKWERRVNAAVA